MLRDSGMHAVAAQIEAARSDSCSGDLDGSGSNSNDEDNGEAGGGSGESRTGGTDGNGQEPRPGQEEAPKPELTPEPTEAEPDGAAPREPSEPPTLADLTIADLAAMDDVAFGRIKVAKAALLGITPTGLGKARSTAKAANAKTVRAADKAVKDAETGADVVPRHCVVDTRPIATGDDGSGMSALEEQRRSTARQRWARSRHAPAWPELAKSARQLWSVQRRQADVRSLRQPSTESGCSVIAGATAGFGRSAYPFGPSSNQILDRSWLMKWLGPIFQP